MGHHDRAPGFGYVTYLASTPEKVWEALTDAGLTAVYRGRRNVSDWWPGSRWEHVRADGSGVVDVVGRVVEGEPPARLVATWAEPGEEGRENRPFRDLRTPAVRGHRPAVTHDDPADESERAAVAAGWPAVPSHLKTLLENGRPLPQKPWRGPAG
ncbi:SRPBCC domain-containing protein [Streptomyces sp. UMAF16]|nr:SRPBCC domain-containing protein [Streptomyces sp. UMAF16]